MSPQFLSLLSDLTLVLNMANITDGMSYEGQQLVRFATAFNLTSYICNAEYYDANENYDPTCEYPFVNSGWAEDGVSGMDDVVLGNCSITYSEASGGTHALSSLIHTLLYIVSFPILIFGEYNGVK